MLVIVYAVLMMMSLVMQANCPGTDCIVSSAGCGSSRNCGVLPQGTLSQVFMQTITPSDLRCPPYVITKPGTYVITKDFQFVPTVNDQPLIKILSSNVTIDLQMFSLFENIPAAQLSGMSPIIRANLIEIGDGLTPITNITIENGSLSGVAGMGVLVYPLVTHVTLRSLEIDDCLAGGVAISGADDVAIECCSILEHGQYNIAGTLNGTYLSGTLFPLTGTCSSDIGAFGLLAYNSRRLLIKDCDISRCGAANLDRDVFGIYMESCRDIEILNTISSFHKSLHGQVTGMFFKFCQRGAISGCQILYNSGYGCVGVDFIEDSYFQMCCSLVSGGISTGDWIPSGTIIIPCNCPDVLIPLLTRCSPCEPFLPTGESVDFTLAYNDYKFGLTLKDSIITGGGTNVNWQSFVIPADWTKFMNAYHAISYALEYYTFASQAYGVRIFSSNHITLDSVTIENTQALNNSAWGILIDARLNGCGTPAPDSGGMCNAVKNSKVVGTTSFSNTTSPNVLWHDFITTFFGNILNAGPTFTVKTGETISMIGRAVGIELRDCVSCTILHNNLVKCNGSLYTFAAGIFLNRSTKSELFGNRMECNIGSDIGYGLLNRVINPTDVTASSYFFDNGYENNLTMDRNINYAVFWSYIGGNFSIKHGFTSDLGILNNIGFYENVQILFDNNTIPVLPCMITMPDIQSPYLIP